MIHRNSEKDIRNRIQLEMNRLKRINKCDLLRENHIYIDRKGDCYLKPVCDLYQSDDYLISILNQWRKQNMHIFPISFKISFESTKKWIVDKLLKNEHRILFIVSDPFDHPVGQMGLLYHTGAGNHFEIENVIRGNDLQPGLMSKALVQLMRWAVNISGLFIFRLFVINDNDAAINFYQKNRFKEVGIRMLNGTNLPYDNNQRDDKKKYFIIMEKNGLENKLSPNI